MKKVFRLFGWVWGLSFMLFSLATMARMQGYEIPVWLEQYRESFQEGLESFLSSSVFGVVFIGGWIAVSLYLSKESGWKLLSEIFGSEIAKFDEPDHLITTSGKFGKINHNGMLKIGGNNIGLVLKVLFPFRIGHPSLFITWQEVEYINIQKGQSTNSRVSLLSKLGALVSPFHYARIKLKRFQIRLFYSAGKMS